MAWLRVDDGFTEHRKLLELKRSDRWTWLEVLTYCARQNQTGIVPKGITGMLKHVTPAFLKTCLEAGLLDEDADGTMSVHDWHEYNPKDPTAASRQAKFRNAHRNGEVTEEVTAENVTRNAKVTPPSPTPTQEEQLGVKEVTAVVPRPGPLDRLLEVLHDKDEGTKNVLLSLHRRLKLSEGDFEYARECATGPGVASPTRVAIAELQKRAAARA